MDSAVVLAVAMEEAMAEDTTTVVDMTTDMISVAESEVVLEVDSEAATMIITEVVDFLVVSEADTDFPLVDTTVTA